LPLPLSEVPDVPPFPVEVFHKNLRKFARETALALACPVDYVAVPILVLGGGALGARRALEIKPGHLQRGALYAAVVGPPGSAKTPALEKVTDPVNDIEEAIQAAWDQEMEVYQALLDAYESDLKEWKKVKAEERGDPPKKPDRPPLKRLTVSDATTESLAPILKENPEGITMVRDELIGWVAAMNQYREGGKGADQQFWLSAWSGHIPPVDRKKTHDQGPLRVRRVFVGVIGGLTPDKLPAIRGDRPRQRAEQDGFIDRVLFSYPPEPPVAEENWLEVAEDTRQVWRDVLDRLRSLQMVPIEEGGQVKGWRSYVVKLTADDRQAWQLFTREHARERNAEDFPPHLIGPWSKLRGYCARLALILHYLRWAAGEQVGEGVDGESMRRAAKLVAYFKAHARKVYAVIDADPRVAGARRLLQWLQANCLERFSKRDAYRAVRGAVKTVEDLDPLLNLLEQHGYVRPEVTTDRPGPGRKPSPHYEVNPLIRGQNGHNGQNSPDDVEDEDDDPHDGGPDPDSVHCVHSVQGGRGETTAGGGADPLEKSTATPWTQLTEWTESPPPEERGDREGGEL
jgi:hypothetical protein